MIFLESIGCCFFLKHRPCMWTLRACAKLLDKKNSCPYSKVVLGIQRTWRELTNFWHQTRGICLRSDNVDIWRKELFFGGKRPMSYVNNSFLVNFKELRHALRCCRYKKAPLTGALDNICLRVIDVDVALARKRATKTWNYSWNFEIENVNLLTFDQLHKQFQTTHFRLPRILSLKQLT